MSLNIYHITTIRCYIEERDGHTYLRDKASGKRVFLITHEENRKSHFLKAIGFATEHKTMMPSSFTQEGPDAITVRGVKKSESADAIRIDIDKGDQEYYFE